MSVRSSAGLAPVGGALSAIVDNLAASRPSNAPVVYGVAWLPDFEEEARAFPLRLRGLEALAGYRHAVALNAGLISSADRVRVLVRAGGALHAFEAYLTLKATQALDPVPLLEGER